jgi:hypothetical protein
MANIFINELAKSTYLPLAFQREHNKLKQSIRTIIELACSSGLSFLRMAQRFAWMCCMAK